MYGIRRLIDHVSQLALLFICFLELGGKILFHNAGINAVQPHHGRFISTGRISERFPAFSEVQKNIAVFSQLTVFVSNIDAGQVLNILIHPRRKCQLIGKGLDARNSLVIISTYLGHGRSDIIQAPDRTAHLVREVVKAVDFLSAFSECSSECSA